MRKMKYSENYRNVTQRHKVSKCHQKKKVDVLDTGLSKLSTCKNHSICEAYKTRYAYTLQVKNKDNTCNKYLLK